MSPSVLDAFDRLRDSNDNFKLDGGAKLLHFLSRSEDEINLQYTLKRVVRSVGANQLNMRTGYVSTLVLILQQFPQISVRDLLNLVQRELHATGSKSEVGDVSVGQILVCGAIFRSGLMLRSSPEDQKEVIQLLFAASGKKSYLKSAAYLFAVDFIDQLDEQQFKSIFWEHFKKILKKPIQEHTLDSLYLLIKIQDKFSGVIKVRKFLGVEEIVCEDTVHSICEELMDITDLNQTNHPIYEHIGKMMANSEHLRSFWSSGIDSQLTKHNRNRELVALKILMTILQNINTNYEVLPDLLTKNFLKLSLDWFKGLQTASKIRNKRDDEDDNKLMIKKEREVLNALANTVKSERVSSLVKIEVLRKLLFYPGDMNIAEITGTTIIKNIFVSMEKEGVKKAAKLFKPVLLNETKKYISEGVERPWFNYERLKASEYLSHLVTHPSVLEETKFRMNIMKLLMCFGFFKISGNEDIAISADLSAAIKTSFYRCLNARLPSVESLVEILRQLCTFIDENLSNERIRVKLARQFPEANVECWDILKKICHKIEKNSDKKKVDNVFLILLYQLGLFLFSEPKYVEMAKESIKELASCYNHYKKEKKNKKKGELSDEPEWIEVMIEVLLSIMSNESKVLRSAVQCVFRLLIDKLTPSVIGQIISILDPESDTNPLAPDSDSESDDDEDEQKKDKNTMNDEQESDEDKHGNDDDNDEGENGGDSETEDEVYDDEEMKIPDQLRMAVQKALGNAAPDTDTESIDADQIDEEEGKKLDKALSEAFKLLRQGKNKKSKKDRKVKKLLTDFRVRALDLIDIYIEKEPSMDMCLGMIAPLMRCLEFCVTDNEQRELESRVRKTLKSISNIKKFSLTDGVTIEILSDYLKSTIEKGTRTHLVYQALGDIITECGTFIVHCSQRLDGQKTLNNKKIKSPLVQIYQESIISFFQMRSCLLPIIFFHKILQTEWEGNYVLLPIIIENTFSENVRQFRRNEGLQLIVGFYNAHKNLKPKSIADKLKPIELKFENSIQKAFKNDKFVVKEQFYKLLARTLQTIQSFYKAINSTCPINFKTLQCVINESKMTMKLKREKKENEDAQIQLQVEEKEIRNSTVMKAGKIKIKKRKISLSEESADKKSKLD